MPLWTKYEDNGPGRDRWGRYGNSFLKDGDAAKRFAKKEVVRRRGDKGILAGTLHNVLWKQKEGWKIWAWVLDGLISAVMHGKCDAFDVNVRKSFRNGD